MDKNGKIFGKISIVDLLVLVLVITVGAGLAYRFMAPAAQVDPGEVTIEYTLRVASTRDFLAEYYQIGLPTFERHTGLYLGTIIDVRTEPRYAHQPAPDGTVVLAHQPGVIVVSLDIRAIGRVTDNAIFVGGTQEINVGGTVFMRTKYVDVETTVDDIRVVR